ncbi:MAG: MBL fold metallo-hydrolase [Desulfobacterales bacterium]
MARPDNPSHPPRPEPAPAPLTVCVLASGSRGNAIYVADATTAVLIDAGLSGVEIERRLRSRGLSPDRLNAVLVTHEHDDHIRGVGVLSRRYRLPVYITAPTLKVAGAQLGRLHAICDFQCGHGFQIDALHFRPFALCHDAEDPTGFTVSANGTRLGIATDLGIATALVHENLKDCAALILEANHDPLMLENGPYPWPLKQRIKSRSGHLANSEARQLLSAVRHPRLRHVILAHLSEKNNSPEKALAEVGLALQQACGIDLTVAAQESAGHLIALP